MLSIVIPTMWKSDYLKSTMMLVEKMPNTELIIIDNNPSGKPGWAINQEQIKYVSQEKNIGVNPAWNLGVSMAQYDWIILMNDDITVNLHTIYLNIKFDNIPKSLWGLPSANFTTELNPTQFKLEVAYPIGYRPLGFGQFMLFRKENYYPIPNEMKIYLGDDIQWQHHFKLNIRPGVFINLGVVGEKSATTEQVSKWSLQHPDAVFFDKWKDKHGFSLPL